MVALKCSKCGSQLRDAVVDLEHNLGLRFLICNSCRYLHELNIDEVKNRLESEIEPGAFGSWALEHLDRYVVTLKLVPFSSKKLKVLDVGAAPGYLTRMIKQLFGYEVYSLDSSHVISFRNFQGYVDAMKRSGIIVKDCDANEDRFPFANQTFDVVLFTEVLEHLHEPKHALSEINRVLKANGRLIFSTVNFLRASNRIKALLGKPTTFHGVKEYTLRELKKLLKDTNFLIKQVIFSDWEERKMVKRTLKSPRLPIFSNFWTMVKYSLAKVMPPLSSYIFIIAMKG